MNYSISFTAGSLLLDETTSVLDYILNDELEEKRNYIIENNDIKINSESARKRVLQEIRKRAKAVDKKVWIKFEKANISEKRILLYYANVKTYLILFDLGKDIIIPKWKSLKTEFSETDIAVFLEKKANNHPEIDEWSAKTRAKVIQVLYRFLREAGILVNGKISSLQAPDHFWVFFKDIREMWFLEFALLNKEQIDKIIGLK